MENKEWIELIKKEFQVSGNVARKMLHAMMVIKELNTQLEENKK